MPHHGCSLMVCLFRIAPEQFNPLPRAVVAFHVSLAGWRCPANPLGSTSLKLFCLERLCSVALKARAVDAGVFTLGAVVQGPPQTILLPPLVAALSSLLMERLSSVAPGGVHSAVGVHTLDLVVWDRSQSILLHREYSLTIGHTGSLP